MTDMFYIVAVSNGDGDWYRLHLTTTHQCLGGWSAPEPLLNTVKRLVVKYKKIDRLERAVEKVNGPLSQSVLERYRDDYDNHSVFEDKLETVISEALEKVKNSNPLFRSAKKFRERQAEKRETVSEPVVMTTVKRRPTLLKHRIGAKLPN